MPRKKTHALHLLITTTSLLIASVSATQASAEINRVRIINQTNVTIYIHKGGFASALSIAPGKWKIFYYPFSIMRPNSDKKIKTGLLVARAGGKWSTTANGYTYLSKPKMLLCIDYNSTENQNKNGNRKWEIKRLGGFDKGCAVTGYKQPWYAENV